MISFSSSTKADVTGALCRTFLLLSIAGHLISTTLALKCDKCTYSGGFDRGKYEEDTYPCLKNAGDRTPEEEECTNGEDGCYAVHILNFSDQYTIYGGCMSAAIFDCLNGTFQAYSGSLDKYKGTCKEQNQGNEGAQEIQTKCFGVPAGEWGKGDVHVKYCHCFGTDLCNNLAAS